MFISLSLETELKTGKFSTAMLDIRCWQGALNILDIRDGVNLFKTLESVW